MNVFTLVGVFFAAIGVFAVLHFLSSIFDFFSSDSQISVGGSGNVQINQGSDNVQIRCNDGHVRIKGSVSSLHINGKKIDI